MKANITKSKIKPVAPKITAPLLKRVAVFLVVFVVLSGIIGSRIISHRLVSRDGFQIYGGAGKALLFGVLSLLLLIFRRDKLPRLKPWRPIESIWLLLSITFLTTALLSINHLIAGSSSVFWIVLTHISILSSVALGACGTFGAGNLATWGKVYKREILISLGLAILFFVFVYVVYGLWRILAGVILHCVRWLLNSIGIHAIIIPPRTLLLDKFGVEIAQYCSGIESIALFTALYALVGLLDWDKLNHRRLLWIFWPALALLFILNIFRVFGLIVAGYYINPHIAFSLFHTYAGMIFFILYSAAFLGGCL